MLSAGGHQDLFGHGGQAPLGETLGDGGAQFGKAIRVVAGGVRVLREVRGDLSEGVDERLPGQSGGGPRQVDRGVLGTEEPGDALGPTAFRQVRPGTGALAAACEPPLAQQVVYGGDGGPAGVQGGGQFPLGGEPDVQSDPSVQDQRADRLGQMAIGGPRSGRVGQHGGELSAAQCPVAAFHPLQALKRVRVGHTNHSPEIGHAIWANHSTDSPHWS